MLHLALASALFQQVNSLLLYLLVKNYLARKKLLFITLVRNRMQIPKRHIRITKRLRLT